MVLTPQMTTDDTRHMMEPTATSADTRSRKSSVNSTDSTGSNYSKNAVRCSSYGNIQKELSLPPTHSIFNNDLNCKQLNGSLTDQTSIIKGSSGSSNRQATSTSCLPDTLSYHTSAKIADHFPQKILTPNPTTTSQPKLLNGGQVNNLPKSKARASLINLRAPVATAEDHDSPDLERKNSFEVTSEDSGSAHSDSSVNDRETVKRSRSSEDCGSQKSGLTGNEKSSSKIRFLPAYKDKTVEEIMQDGSPRGVWHHSTRNVHRSQSTRTRSPNTSSPNTPSSYYYSNTPGSNNMGSSSINSSTLGSLRMQPGRIYTPSPQSIRSYNTINRSRPNSMNVRVNDGTHPRMPMRAMHPQTYHGVPVHVQPPVQRFGTPTGYDTAYGTVRRNVLNTQPPSQSINYNHKARSQGDMRANRGRIYSDNSSPSHSQVESEIGIRGSNSEPDIDQPQTQRRQVGRAALNRGHNTGNFSIPSGTYVASSSMTSLPQYAQLMPPSGPVPQRADSTGNVRRPSALPLSTELVSRHSYTGGTYQPQAQNNIPNSKFSSYEDVFPNSSGSYSKGSTTPTSPVSRQPSYLTAMSSPVRRQAHPDYKILEENGDQDLVDNKVVLRNKSAHQTEDDAHQKILRRTSYLMATSKPEYYVEEGHKTPQKTKKLKRFFGEGTPAIKEAQERALQSSSQQESFTLPDHLDVQKTGILAIKVVTVEGKRSPSRSWRGMGAVLSRDMLYLVKDKKENATMLTTPSGSLSIDEKPISIIACFVAIAHSYTKKRHVFKLRTATASEYLLQAEDDKDMVDWIKAIEANRHPDKERSSVIKSEQLSSAELVKRINDQQLKLNHQKRRTLGSLSFKSKQPHVSPKPNDSQKDKKKRFSLGPGKQSPLDYNSEPASGDFGIPVNECSPSHENEFVPLVVELCTKAIEDRGLDFVGIYRVPGNKAAVELLKKELNQGIINLDNDKWRDVNVLSSLLKTFFRRLPDSLITSEKYKEFIETNKLSDNRARLMALKKLIAALPDYNFETLKYLVIHLRKVAEHGETNKMDTRNLAIIFGPTIIKSGDRGSDDVMSLIADMSDQCRIMETLIIYYDWIFSPTETEPPALDEADITSSCAPISETMNNMSADIALITNDKSKSKAQLMSEFSSAVNKNISKVSLTHNSISSPMSTSPSKDSEQSQGDDHGFLNRNLQQKVAARNQKLLEIREEKSREAWGMSQGAVSSANPDSLPEERYIHHPHYFGHSSPLPRCQSEESVLVGEHHRVTHDQYPHHADYKYNHHTRQVSNSDRQSDGTPPPPIPARGIDVKPPLPPKPMQLYHAKPTHITDMHEEQHNEEMPNKLYENYEHLQLEVRQPVVTQQRTLRVIHNQLKSSSLQRRGSLDSMMDTLEPFPNYSSSSSTESQDGSDLLSSITATFDQKLKLLVDPKYRLDGQGNRRPKNSSDSSSMGSSVWSQVWSQRGPPDSGSAQHHYASTSDQSRESLLSILSNKENMQACESFSSNQDFEHGFDGSTSSIGSAPHRQEAKVGIASRIERKDIKPLGYAPASNASVARIVNATGSVISNRNDDTGNSSSEEEKDFTNNNAIDYDYMPFIHRGMSDEKKRIRRRHTVGGARDFDSFNDMLASYRAKQACLQEANAAAAAAVQPQETLTAWQRLQPRDNKEPVSLRDWIERERCRASSPELEMHATPNIMHLHKVDQKLTGSLLESNT